MAIRPSVTGGVGTPPPPGAPVQSVTGADTPGVVAFENLNQDTLDALADRIDPSLVGLDSAQMAQQNERELAPLNPVPAGAPPITKTPVVAASDQPVQAAAPAPSQQQDALARRHTGRLRTAGVQATPQVSAVSGVVAATDKTGRAVQPAGSAHVPAAPAGVIPVGDPPDQNRRPQAGTGIAHAPYQPAASNTDSPSRGIPRAQTDPGKVITGGFGVAADAQYFPLDGAELLQVVYALMDQLAAKIQNDLRFSIAATYPRVSAKVLVQVEGYGLDQALQIQVVMPPHERTPVEVAESRADEVVFIVKTQRREFDEAGNSESPPNAMRAEIGAAIPRKQAFGEGARRVIADIGS